MMALLRRKRTETANTSKTSCTLFLSDGVRDHWLLTRFDCGSSVSAAPPSQPSQSSQSISPGIFASYGPLITTTVHCPTACLDPLTLK